MELNDKNLINLIFIAIIFLAPLLMKLLAKKKLGVKKVEENDDDVHQETDRSYPLEMPRPPKAAAPPAWDNADNSVRSVFPNEPIKPRMF